MATSEDSPAVIDKYFNVLQLTKSKYPVGVDDLRSMQTGQVACGSSASSSKSNISVARARLINLRRSGLDFCVLPNTIYYDLFLT